MMIAFLALAAIARLVEAGTGGCQPSGENYRFQKLWPSGPEDVGEANFQNDSCKVTPNGLESEEWSYSDGQYHKPDSDVTFCVQDGTPLQYIHKYDGVPQSSGHLIPMV